MFFLEKAASAARIVSGDLAVGRRSSRRDPFGISSGPLGGDGSRSLVVFVVSNPYVCVSAFRGSKGDSSNICFKVLIGLLFYYISLFSSDIMKFNETGAIRNVRRSLIIGCAVSWEALSSTNCNRHLLAAASLYALSPPNHVAQADGKYGVLFTPREKIYLGKWRHVPHV